MTTATDNLKRPRGRPKGYPKSGGRRRGTPNRDRAATIEKIMKLADPLEFLCKVARGDRMSAASESDASTKSWWVPTGDQRISAAQTLARKVLPDMKAVEYSGDPPAITKIVHQVVDVGPTPPLTSTGDDRADGDKLNGDSPARHDGVVYRERTGAP